MNRLDDQELLAPTPGGDDQGTDANDDPKINEDDDLKLESLAPTPGGDDEPTQATQATQATQVTQVTQPTQATQAPTPGGDDTKYVKNIKSIQIHDTVVQIEYVVNM